MGIDIKAGGRKATQKRGRQAPVSENLYVRLLVKLYRFLARRTDAKFNQLVLKRAQPRASNPERATGRALQVTRALTVLRRHRRRPVHVEDEPAADVVARLKKFMDKKAGDKIAVVVGTVTDDVRMYEVPKMTVCALRFGTARPGCDGGGASTSSLCARRPARTRCCCAAPSHRGPPSTSVPRCAHRRSARRRGARLRRWWRRLRCPCAGWGGCAIEAAVEVGAAVGLGRLWGWAAVPCVCGGACALLRGRPVGGIAACGRRSTPPQHRGRGRGQAGCPAVGARPPPRCTQLAWERHAGADVRAPGRRARCATCTLPRASPALPYSLCRCAALARQAARQGEGPQVRPVVSVPRVARA